MKDIKGYEGEYAITSCGKVWSYKSKKFLKPMIIKNKYHVARLINNKKVEHKYIHKLVAEAYIPNPNNYDTIDHIDGNKSNNCINNLQWMKRGDNAAKSNKKKVRCIETNQIFNSITEASKFANTDPSNIGRVCNNKRVKTAGGYHWELVKED